MIYDCFTFFNELDLLEIRLNILNDVVDKFVLVEMNKTFSGKDKPLYYQENKERFSKFEDKIIHVVVDDCPTSSDSWILENHQRNCISRGLLNCQDDDIIIISDLDEIPNPDVIKNLDCSKHIYILEQKMYYYFVNYQDCTHPIWYQGTRVLSYQNFLHGLDNVKINYSVYLPKDFNKGTTANKIRMYTKGKYIPNGGWHFSFLGGVDAIIKKIQSFSHQEFNKPEYTDKDLILKRIASGEDIFKRKGYAYHPVILDKTFPKYILNNQEKYKHLIFFLTAQEKRKLLMQKVLFFLFHQIKKENGRRKIYILGIKVLSYGRKSHA